MTFGSSGTGTGMDNSIPEVREREGNGKNPFPKFGNRKGMKKSIPKIWEWEGNEKIDSQISGTKNEENYSKFQNEVKIWLLSRPEAPV